MRIFNEKDVEVQEKDCDLTLGYLTPDKVFVQHHDAVSEVPEEGHYYPKKFYFMDGTNYEVHGEGENDPHVKPNDDGLTFEYLPDEEEETKEIKGTDVAWIVDKERQEAKEAYDEYEDIQRYKLYTEEQLRERAISNANFEAEKIKKTQSEAFINFMIMPMSLEMSDEEIQQFNVLIPDFQPGKEYKNKAVVKYKNVLYRAIQAVDSITTTNYTPDQANSYWKRVDAPNEEGIYEWSQPYGATDCYQTGDKVTYQSATWTSAINNNVWAPGVYGWEKDPDSGSEEPVDEYPDFVPPTGAHDAYKIGDKVTFEGKHYESVIDNNTWSPADYPAGWKEIPMEESEE